MNDDAIQMKVEVYGAPAGLRRVRAEAIRAFRLQYPACWTFEADDATGIIVQHTHAACANKCPIEADRAPTTYPLSDALRVLLLGHLITARAAPHPTGDGNLSA